MKRILAFFMVMILLLAAIGCNNTDNTDSDTKKGELTLAGKTPKELYDAAIAYIKSLENYEVVIESNYKTTYEDETSEESSTTLHKCSGDSFYYLYKAGQYEEFFLHDGSMLYKSMNNVNEKVDLPYTEFMESWGNVTSDGMLIVLKESSFDKKLFIPEGDGYYLDFLISQEEYAELAGGTVEKPVTYKVYFDKEGNVTSFQRSMFYYYHDVVLVEDNMKVTLQNVGKVAKVEAPQNAELYSVRVKAEDIDLSSVESLDLFEATGEVTDYVLLEMKVEGKTASSEGETNADAQIQAEGETDATATTEKAEDYYGKILIRLYPDVAPLTVSNFKSLVGRSFYKGLIIHRIVPNFVIQGGDPKGDGTGGSDNDIFGEFTTNGFTNNLSHKRGVVSMARSDDPDSASSQFFICLADVSSTLDENYASFGYVVYGMDTVDHIAALETDSSDKPIVKVTIENASFVKKKA